MGSVLLSVPNNDSYLIISFNYMLELEIKLI